MRHHAKRRADRSNRCRDISIMPPGSHNLVLRWSPFCRRAVVACIHSLFGVVIVDKTLTLSLSICTFIIQLAPRPTSHTTQSFFYSTSLKHLSHTLSISSLLPLSSIPSSTLAPYMHKLHIGLRTYRQITSHAAALPLAGFPPAPL